MQSGESARKNVGRTTAYHPSTVTICWLFWSIQARRFFLAVAASVIIGTDATSESSAEAHPMKTYLSLPRMSLLALFTCFSGLGLSDALLTQSAQAQEESQAEPIYSGPQVGEELTPFEITGVFDDKAGKRFDPITEAQGKPVVLLFLHQANRPSIGMTRLLMNYLAERKDQDVASCVVWLTADPTQAENDLKRMRHALPEKTMIGIFPDGVEGPGAYGLNRQVTLTILVGKENKVTANYALVQPSIQVDLPKILKSIVDIAGGEVPDVSKMQQAGMERPNMRANANNNRNAPNEALTEQIRTYLRPLIQKDATDQQVDEAAAAVEAWIEKDEAARKEIARISNTIVNSGKLENYGTPHCQEILRKWAEKYK